MERSQNAPVLDVRDLQAPDNILAVLKKAAELPRDTAMEIIMESNPFQLYDLLQQRGFFLEMTLQKDGTYRGSVKRRDLDALSH
jgi:hypothetical protein